jgi:(p)ppGpp synthase/HD superfamily hydrolase
MREGRKHVPTCLGKIVYHHTQSMLELAIENQWRLKAIDSIEIYSAPEGISSEEYNKIIDKMIANENIRAIIRRNNSNNNTSNNSKSLSEAVDQGHLDEGQITEERQQIYPLQEIK